MIAASTRLLAGLVTATAFSAFEQMAIAPILPTIATELDGMDLYALGYAASLASGVLGMVAGGAAADRGRLWIGFASSAALFTGGLVIMALAPAMDVFIAGRVVQGLGTGGVAVLCYAAIAVALPVARHRPAIAWLASAWLLPTMIGPLVAVALTDLTSWRVLFLAIAVVSPLGTVLAAPGLKGAGGEPRGDPRGAGHARRFGMALLVSCGLLSVSAAAAVPAVPLPVLVAGGAAATVIGLVFLLPPGSFRGRRGLPAAVVTRAAGAASVYTVQAYLPLILEERYIDGAWVSGLVLTASGVGWSAAAIASARMQRSLDSRTAMRIGAAGLLVGTASATIAIGLQWHPAVLAVSWVAVGVAMGVLSPGATALVVGHASARGRNSSALTISETAFAAVGIALGGCALGVFTGASGFVAVGALGVAFAAVAVVLSSRTAGVPRRPSTRPARSVSAGTDVDPAGGP